MGLTNRSSSAFKTQAPRCVVRATRDFAARTGAELSFKKDDFFYVLSPAHSDEHWYDVTNPLTGDRGLVPASHFEVMESRQDRINRINRSASNAAATPMPLGLARSMPAAPGLYAPAAAATGSAQQRRPSGGSGGSYPAAEPAGAVPLRIRTTSIQHQQHAHLHRAHSPAAGSRTPEEPPAIIELHATALYAFDAANPNELSIAEGDDLIVVAQSTDDWLVARPVLGSGSGGGGGSGGATTPGLVPAAYVELHDHITGAVVNDLHAYLARCRMRLRTALEWERHQRERRATRSMRSTASASSGAGSASGGSKRASVLAGQAASPPSSAYDDDQSPTPRSSVGSILPAGPAAIGIQKTRARAMTASSSTSSIAERSSFRQLHKIRQVSGGSLQHLGSENHPPFHPTDVAAVSVPSFICKDGAYLFQISLRLASGAQRNIYRAYEDIICCRNQLSEVFPDATLPLKLARLSMHSSSMLYLNDTIAERRRNEIDEYVSSLLTMPDEVVECAIVQRLFGSRVAPVPAAAAAATTPPPDHHSRAHFRAQQDRSTPASASSTDTAIEPYHAGSYATVAGAAAAPYKAKTMSCDSKATAVAELPAQKTYQHQLAHKASSGALGAADATVKVKIRLGDDMVALRLPSELTLQELKARIAVRVGRGAAAASAASISRIVYDAPSGEPAPLRDDQDWADALLATNNKPVLTIVQ
ncbi:bud emergence protein 1 [Coemansia javaensis]|uniref:Bud emergence protein 1 n=1 Tax=Coemansia javaensis TaxID=2761396 RepID=A0A9W8HBG1_9FUNG|nr:bud emergence protein 1 [Coemansia javaensis]